MNVCIRSVFRDIVWKFLCFLCHAFIRAVKIGVHCSWLNWSALSLSVWNLQTCNRNLPSTQSKNILGLVSQAYKNIFTFNSLCFIRTEGQGFVCLSLCFSLMLCETAGCNYGRVLMEAADHTEVYLLLFSYLFTQWYPLSSCSQPGPFFQGCCCSAEAIQILSKTQNTLGCINTHRKRLQACKHQHAHEYSSRTGHKSWSWHILWN